MCEAIELASVSGLRAPASTACWMSCFTGRITRGIQRVGRRRERRSAPRCRTDVQTDNRMIGPGQGPIINCTSISVRTTTATCPVLTRQPAAHLPACPYAFWYMRVAYV
eukprot:scaffold46313_cov29-Tisochrysis_lutea.AAC.1